MACEKIHNFRRILKDARNKQNLTQEQLAEKLDISTRYLMTIENETKAPSLQLLFKMIRVFNIDANTIVYPETKISKIEQAKTKLSNPISCYGEHEINVLIATARALLKDQS